MKQTCGNCKWGKHRMTNHNPPRAVPYSMGRCEWPVPALPVLPAWIVIVKGGNFVSASNAGCPTWQAKPVVILEEAKP